MALSNYFKEGCIVKYNGRIGRIMRNAIDFRYWEVDLYNTIKILHYRDLELVSAETSDYEESIGGKWWKGYVNGTDKLYKGGVSK